MEFLIDMMERRDSTLRGYGEFHLFMTNLFGLLLRLDINTFGENKRYITTTEIASNRNNNREYPLQIPLKIPLTIPLKIPSRSETTYRT